MLPGTSPVVVRPYRYPQLLQDEVERQCTEMLQQDIIRESTSAFSSPVLVQKVHGTWRFYVDYKALNTMTLGIGSLFWSSMSCSAWCEIFH